MQSAPRMSVQQQCGTGAETGSELERLQLALHESEHRYQQLAETVTNYSYSVEVRGGQPIATWHSPGCFATTGYRPEDYAADPYLWITMVHSQDRELVCSHLARVLAHSNMLPPIEHRIHHADGTIRWVRATITPRLDDNRQVARYDGLIEDITQHKRLEERFRQLVEFAPDAMVVSDPQGQIVLVNVMTERLFGYPREELLGQCVDVLVPQPFRAQHRQQRQAYAACPQARRMGTIASVPCLCRDGGQFLADISLCPLQTEEGVLVYAAIRDITQQRQGEKAAHEREMQLLAARQIQQLLLPHSHPKVAGFEIAGASFPAEYVGGDSFDYVPMQDGSLAIAISDVVGHGFASALMMASTHAYIRSLARIRSDPGEILGLANTILVDENRGERFVTFLLGRLDPNAKTFDFCGAGHPAGYLLDARGDIKHSLRSAALPLGIEAQAEFHGSGPFRLLSGDLVLLLTDGILEAQSPSDELFGIERTLELVRTHRGEHAEAIIELLHQAVLRFAQRESPADDVTIVIAKVLA